MRYAMKQDLSWEHAVVKYEALYERVLKRK